MIDSPLSEDDRALAAEYVLRLLAEDEARAAALRIQSDPDFAAEVRNWSERFAVLAEHVEPVAPSPSVERELMQRLFGSERNEARWSVRVWQGLAGLAVAASLVLSVLFMRTSAPQDPALFVAELQGADNLRVVAVVNATAHEIRMTLAGVEPDAGRDLQLWGIPDGDDPVPIGILPEDPTGVLLVPESLFGRAVGLTLAISNEPDGGSPTGAPTGEILATGQLTGL